MKRIGSDLPTPAPRSRTLGWRTGTGPMPVWIARSGRKPLRTSREAFGCALTRGLDAHHDAVVIGDVHIGAGSTIWPSAVLRGDYGRIVVGERTSIQDGTVIHATEELPTVIGSGSAGGFFLAKTGAMVI